MSIATLTSKGQITLPKEIREQLQLQPGDRVEYLVGPNGGITIFPVTSDVTILKGLIPNSNSHSLLKPCGLLLVSEGDDCDDHF